MKLDVSASIRNPGQEYEFHGEQAIAPQDIIGDTVTFDDAVVDGVFFSSGDGNITVDGRFTTVAHAHCANCLAPAQEELSGEFRETFIRDGDPEDDEEFSYTGHLVDFEKLVMSYAVMALPIRFLCKEDCRGWRTYYKPDDETGRKDDQDHPFAALQQLLTPEFMQQLSGDEAPDSPDRGS